jgi:hypothetical protein
MYNPQDHNQNRQKKNYQSNGQIGFQLKNKLGVDEEERFLSPLGLDRDAEERRRSASVD